MKCPKCSHEDTKVIDSRLSDEGRSVRRRRACLNCDYRYTTYEKEEDFALLVEKKDKRTEAFSREKLLRSLQIACQKRPIHISNLEAIAERIEKKLYDQAERTVTTIKLGDMVMDSLRTVDHIAYVRFASVYKDFRDIKEFLEEVRILGHKTADRFYSSQPPELSKD